jgi:aminocarboxymuconate-semialdehyde decarboxylase
MDFGSSGCVDLHTHVYLPRYVKELKARSTVPRIIEVDGQERILLLPSEEEDSTTAKGRPFGSQYWSVDEKIKFMDQHGISVSVSANFQYCITILVQFLKVKHVHISVDISDKV